MKPKVLIISLFSLLIFFSCSSSSPATVEIVENSFDFGVVYLENSANHDFAIQNNTSEIVSITDARIDGSSEFIIAAGVIGSTVLPKDLSYVTITFEPVDEGAEQATLYIAHSASDEEFVITLNATGDTKPEFEVDQTICDFGKLRKPLSKSKDITVTNIGTAELTLTSISISGINSSEFTITAGGTTPVIIDPKDTYTITVKWTSADPVGIKSASLDIEHDADGSPNSVTLTADTLAIPPIVFNSTTLKDAEYYHPYDETISVSGGTGSYTFSVITGTLPAGLALNSQTGKITGKPTKVEKQDFEVEVDDTISTASKQFSIDVKIVSGWIDVTPSGVALSGKECITSYKKKLYYFSGSSNSYDIRIFDPVASTWTVSTTKLAYDHALGNACVYNDLIYVIAGTNSSTVERYDPVADTIATDTPVPVSKFTDFAVGVYNNEIYCIGAYDGSGGPFVSAYKFTPGTTGNNGVWTKLPDVVTGGFGSALTVYNNQIVVFGGWDSSDNDIVRTYDPTTGAEQVLGNLYTVTSRFAWGRIGNVLYVGVGGKNTFHKYDLSTNTATKLADSPVTTTYYASAYTECDGRIYVNNNSTDRIYAYIP